MHAGIQFVLNKQIHTWHPRVMSLNQPFKHLVGHLLPRKGDIPFE